MQGMSGNEVKIPILLASHRIVPLFLFLAFRRKPRWSLRQSHVHMESVLSKTKEHFQRIARDDLGARFLPLLE